MITYIAIHIAIRMAMIGPTIHIKLLFSDRFPIWDTSGMSIRSPSLGREGNFPKGTAGIFKLSGSENGLDVNNVCNEANSKKSKIICPT